VTQDQALNTLKWVEALLSGQYKHGKDFMFNPSTETHTSLGVAMEAFGLPIEPGTPGNRFSGWKHFGWYHETFGGGRSPFVIEALDSRAKSYLPVASMLLDSVPKQSANIRQRIVALDIMLQEALKLAEAMNNVRR
jgi:hypothetical protein